MTEIVATYRNTGAGQVTDFNLQVGPFASEANGEVLHNLKGASAGLANKDMHMM